MSVIGIDFGNQTCYVGAAIKGGVEILLNDYSQRPTPACISFTESNRMGGVAARQAFMGNMKNSVLMVKRLIGVQFRDARAQKELGMTGCALVEREGGEIGIKVRYLGSESVFTPEQVAGMLFARLRQKAELAVGNPVGYCVISVPCFTADRERRRILDAAKIGGLPVLRLMNDLTAAALAYGLPRNKDLPATGEAPRRVIFIDVGYAATQLAAVEFNQSHLKVVATAWDTTLGGRRFDERLREHFTGEFKKKYRIDASSAARPYRRLMDECEKVKKQMSMNSNDIPLTIECFMEDRDVSAKVNREQFEKLIQPELAAFGTLCQQVQAETKWTKKDIFAVELVGGSTRMPAIKAIVEQVFSMAPSTGLNSDEAIAKGCAFQCALLSPTVATKEWTIQDLVSYPIQFTWQLSSSNECVSLLSGKEHYPITRQVTLGADRPFKCQISFDKKAVEAMPKGEQLPPSLLQSNIGEFAIRNVTPNSEGAPSQVRLKLRMDMNGVMSFSSASILTKVLEPVEDDEPMQVDEAAPASGTNAPAADAAPNPDGVPNEAQASGDGETKERPPSAGAEPGSGGKSKKTKKMKKSTRTVELPYDADYPAQLASDRLTHFVEMENEMAMTDKLEKEKADAKNSVEEYVYDLRDKLESQYRDYIVESDRKTLRALLDDTEQWLYGDGENETKSVYVQRFELLRSKGEPLRSRFDEWEKRPKCIERLSLGVQLARKFLTQKADGDEKYAHIGDEDIAKVQTALASQESLLQERIALHQATKRFDDPPFTAKSVDDAVDAFQGLWRPIMNKPKPKVEPPPPPPSAADADAASKSESAPMNDGVSENHVGDQQPMDVE